VNRVLQDFRRERLLSLNRSEFHLLDQRKLEEVADFAPAYLHQSPAN
jgi:hypothetical protein